MRGILYSLFITSLLFISCNGGNEHHETKEQKEQKESVVVTRPKGNEWYARYTGTIAGQAVVVNLNHYGRNEMNGYYYYSKQGVIMDLYSDDDSTKGGNYFIFETDKTEHPDEYDYHENPHWLIAFNDNGATGKWVSLDGKKQYDIVLKEDYTDACRFDIRSFKDSAIVAQAPKGRGVSSSLRAAVPSDQNKKEDSALIMSALQHAFSGDSAGDKNLDEYMARVNKAFFKQYFDDNDTTEETEDDPWPISYDRNEQEYVLYNDGGWLVFEFREYLYLGGAHGINAMNYTCLDMQQKKVWKLKDIMKVDARKLSGIIEQEVRHLFKVPPRKKLSDVLMADTIPVTDNIYISPAGIVFSYSPYEIASYANGQLSFLIPYTKLMGMLTPEFKKRMKLE